MNGDLFTDDDLANAEDRMRQSASNVSEGLTSDEIDDLHETLRRGLYLPADVRIDLIRRLLVTVDEANKRALAAHGIRFGPCICEYNGPSRVMVGCPVHYPDPAAEAEGETA